MAYKVTYGALYNWYTVNTGKLCPKGWRVPNDDEWTSLTSYLGGSSVAGGKMKEIGTIHWFSPNTGADNSSGFSGLPGGQRQISGTFLSNIGLSGNFWSATVAGSPLVWSLVLDYYTADAYRQSTGMANGYSVRCIKD
jgi:uncharacterized protein (TIGR02145 family)